MDISRIGAKLRPLDTSAVTDVQWKRVVRKAQELQRMCNLKFDANSFGIGEVAKAVLCLDIASSAAALKLARSRLVKASGLSEKAYTHALATLQNALGVRPEVDIRELAIQFGCVRVVELTRRNLSEFIQRFKSCLAEERRASADFSRPAYLVSAFYLTSKRQKLKVDRHKLMEVTNVTDEELLRATAQMQEHCPDLFGQRAPIGETRAADASSKLSVSGKKRAADSSTGQSADHEDGDEERVTEGENEFDKWKEKIRKDSFSAAKKNGSKLKQAKLEFSQS